jgi:hypothetical protein
MRAGQFWRGRRIAPAHEGPRNESNNNAHEPTSGRSTRYGSGHLIRVFRDIGHIFSSLYPSLAVLFLSRFAPRVGLVILRQTFVRRCHAAIVRAEGSRTSNGTSSTLPGGKKHHTAGASRAAARGKTPHPHASSVASRFPFCLV